MSQSINPFGFIYQETDISSAHLFGFIPTPFPPPPPPKSCLFLYLVQAGPLSEETEHVW